MAISIDKVSIGMSHQGAANYLQDLNYKAITETQTILRDIEKIRTAFEAGWQGQAEINFMTNLQNSVNDVCNTLESLQDIITSEFNSIAQAWKEQDENMVQVRN